MKSIVQYLFNLGLIYGCGKPFRLQNDIAEICDYF